MTDDHLLGWYLAYTYGLVCACVFTCWIPACLPMVDLVPSYMFLIGIDG